MLLVEGHLLCDLQTDAHVYFAVTMSKQGKMPLKVYKDQIWEPVVKPSLLKDQDYVLKEDGGSEHENTQNRNIVRVWKEENSLN